MKAWLPRVVARVPTTVHTKLLLAFLTIVVLLITMGLVGLYVLSGVNQRTEEAVKLQRKIAAYRQLQHGTMAQLYSVTSALLVPEEQTLSATLRQLNQFGYDLDRLEFVASDEAELLNQVRKEYDRFIETVTEVINLIRAGKADEGRELQRTHASPLAERLERLTNQLVNRAAADVVASIETSHAAYANSRWVVIAFAVGSIGLALTLGYAFSWSLIGPVKEIDSRLKQIASGDFSQRIEIVNRDELGTLAANLNRMNDDLGELYRQLQTANRHKSQFLASVNHELRTPLSAIMSYAGLVMSDTGSQISPLQKENLQDLLNNADRLLTLIDSLLDIAKIEAGKLEVRIEPVEVGEIIQSATFTIESTLTNDRIHVVRDIAPSIPVLNTDRNKLRQVVLNLLDNSVKFTERGEVRISVWQQDGALKVAVSDTGIGIPTEYLNQVFEEFHRGTSGKEYRGTGLGLAIVKRLVGLLGGHVEVSSVVGVGSTFTITLPFEYREKATA